MIGLVGGELAEGGARERGRRFLQTGSQEDTANRLVHRALEHGIGAGTEARLGEGVHRGARHGLSQIALGHDTADLGVPHLVAHGAGSQPEQVGGGGLAEHAARYGREQGRCGQLAAGALGPHGADGATLGERELSNGVVLFGQRPPCCARSLGKLAPVAQAIGTRQ
ncbi:MAG: hypothetical protein R3B70_37360 [Polyangiaceae bacterium]